MRRDDVRARVDAQEVLQTLLIRGLANAEVLEAKAVEVRTICIMLDAVLAR